MVEGIGTDARLGLGSYSSLRTRTGRSSGELLQGPFTLVDADTRKPMRRNKFGGYEAALAWGYEAYGRSDRDFVVLDKFLTPIPRSKSERARD
jgi:hypothetical protein